MIEDLIGNFVQQLSPLQFEVRTTMSQALDFESVKQDLENDKVQFRDTFSVLLHAINGKDPDVFKIQFTSLSLLLLSRTDQERNNKALVKLLAFLRLYNRSFEYRPNPLYPIQTLNYKEVLTRKGGADIQIIDNSFEFYSDLAELKLNGYDDFVAVELHPYLSIVQHETSLILSVLEEQFRMPGYVKEPPEPKQTQSRKVEVQGFAVSEEMYTKKAEAFSDLKSSLEKNGFIEPYPTRSFKNMFSPTAQKPRERIKWKAPVVSLAYFLRNLRAVLGLKRNFPIFEVASLWFEINGSTDVNLSSLKNYTKQPAPETKQLLDKALKNLT